MKWVNLPAPRSKTPARWAALLSIAKAEQLSQPELVDELGGPLLWAELWMGNRATCWAYVRDLRAGYTPGRRHRLNTEGYVFRVQALASNMGRVVVRWEPTAQGDPERVAVPSGHPPTEGARLETPTCPPNATPGTTSPSSPTST